MNDCESRVRGIIAAQGPIGIAQYMRIALSDPEFGYYVRRHPILGDFITAPEISQIFGELIGLFFVQVWDDQGRPRHFRLVELGPGRGTLMADILRAAHIRPDFVDAADVELIEISPVLRDSQRHALNGHNVRWRESVDEVPSDAPVFLLANEFFDALPVRQLVRRGSHWYERRIGLEAGQLCFTTDSEPSSATLVPAALRNAFDGDVYEFSEMAERLAQNIGGRVADAGGAALIIDYGHDRPGFADTFQAVRAHHFADPLAAPGEADLTCHVDFAALARCASSQGARVSGPVTQAAFLAALGVRERAEVLKHGAPGYGAVIDSGVERLIGETQMGRLFKVLGISPPAASPLPGFS